MRRLVSGRGDRSNWLAVCTLIVAASPAFAQDDRLNPNLPLSCTSGAVGVEIDRTPPARFVPVDAPARFPEPSHEFTFSQGPHRRVWISLTAAVEARPSIHGSGAELGLLVATSASSNDMRDSGTRWWRLVPGRATDDLESSVASALIVDAWSVQRCLSEGACPFAHVDRASDDEGVAVLVLGFTYSPATSAGDAQTHARLMLDFRGGAPVVAATMDCDYYEGTGACGAVNATMMPRSDISCDWSSAAGDFACQQNGTAFSSEGYRDFYLTNSRPFPARPGTRTTVEEAVRHLIGSGQSLTVVVPQRGLVRVLHEVRLGIHHLLVVAVGTDLFLASAKGDVVTLEALRPRPLIYQSLNLETDDHPTDWTSTDGLRFVAARELARRTGFVVVQIATSGDVHWLGLELRRGKVNVDLLTVVSGYGNANCGFANASASAVSIGTIRRWPFRARMMWQPATRAHFAHEALEWLDAAETGAPPPDGCAQPGEVRWVDGEFTFDAPTRPCAETTRPYAITVGPDGRISATLSPPPEPR